MTAEQFEIDLGKKLQKLREAKGKTQAEVAEELGLNSRETVKQWETWDRHIKARDLIKLSEYYGVSSDYLLGLSEVRSPETDMQAVCRFTGLSEYAIRVLKLGETAPHAINLLANPYTIQTVQKEWSVLKSPLWKFAAALVQLEHAAIPAIIEAVKKDPDGQYFDVVSKKESVELALFRFEKACREIPPAVFLSDMVLDELNDIEQKRYQVEFLKYQTEESQNGEHTED